MNNEKNSAERNKKIIFAPQSDEKIVQRRQCKNKNYHNRRAMQAAKIQYPADKIEGDYACGNRKESDFVFCFYVKKFVFFVYYKQHYGNAQYAENLFANVQKHRVCRQVHYRICFKIN